MSNLEMFSSREIYTTYIIKDPRDGAPIYIGQTKNFEKRKNNYLKNALKPPPNIGTINISVYLIRLKEMGRDPLFEAVDQQNTEEESLLSEIKWVKKTIQDGFPVLNKWKVHTSLSKNYFSRKETKEYFKERLAKEVL